MWRGEWGIREQKVLCIDTSLTFAYSTVAFSTLRSTFIICSSTSGSRAAAKICDTVFHRTLLGLSLTVYWVTVWPFSGSLYDRFLGLWWTVFWVTVWPFSGSLMDRCRVHHWPIHLCYWVFDWPLQGQSLTVFWVPVWPFLSLWWTDAGSIIERLLGFLIEHAYWCWFLDIASLGRSTFTWILEEQFLALRSFSFAPSHNGTLCSAGYIVMSKDSNGVVYLDWFLILLPVLWSLWPDLGSTRPVLWSRGPVFMGSLWIDCWVEYNGASDSSCGTRAAYLEVRIFFAISITWDLSVAHWNRQKPLPDITERDRLLSWKWLLNSIAYWGIHRDEQDVFG